MSNDLITWIKNKPDRFGIQLMRFMFAVLWLTQGLSKIIFRSQDMYKDNNGFLGDLSWMRDTNPLPFITSLLDNVIIPNINIMLVFVIATEIFIALSLGLGIFTRLGSFTGGLMTIVLWVFTLGWDEWIWTYPLIFLPHVLFFLSQPGKEFGVDKILDKKENLNKILRYMI